MAYSTPGRRIVTIRASRDTIVLVASAVAMTFALSYAVHTRPTSAPADAVAVAPQQEWVGKLADVSPDANQPAEAMTSASLVVSPMALALPSESRTSSAKARACDATPCPTKAAAPLPPTRQKTASTQMPTPSVEIVSVTSEPRGASGMGRFNPLNHLPDAVRRPFDYAGNTISGWIHRL